MSDWPDYKAAGLGDIADAYADGVLMTRQEFIDSMEKVGGTYSHPWRCSNCDTDHGGEGCDDPDFGEWEQWYRERIKDDG